MITRYKADKSFLIAPEGQKTPVEAYLDIKRMMEIAREQQVVVVHPGYGFLAENAEFAREVTDAGIAFCGPSAKVIEACGDKTKARELAISAGVPVVPGSEAITNQEQAKAFCDLVGFPVIIKAAFGGTVFIEKFLDHPRHIEVQLLADNHGNVVHLFERDCSVQRRHQKVVEMGPALNLDSKIREKILSDAVNLAKKVGYRNAGTAEFLVDKNNDYYFIEINPRIQVEHTVTEEITGIDIVSAQIQIALGASLVDLGLIQSKITARGFAIQCRVTTEDPSLNFQPDTGRIVVYRSPAGNGVRLDGGPGYTNAFISPHYDSLLAKVTCLGQTFENSRRKLICALNEFRVRGVKTNIKFVIRLLEHEEFKKGSVWTTFIDDTPGLIGNFDSGSRGQQLLLYLGEMAVNGSKVVGQSGVPILQSDVVVPEFKGLTPVMLKEGSTKGWKEVLDRDGPEAFCKAVRSHKGLLIMDTTWRDAHQSLLATRVRTIDIAKIAPQTSHLFKNLFAIECWGGATFDVSMRFLNECPWERLKILRKLVPNVPFQMLLRGANAVGYTSYPDNIVYEFCKKAKECGVDIFRVFDSLNYMDNLKLGIDAVKKAGGVAEAAIAYTGDVSDLSRKHYDLGYYLDLTDKLVSAGIHILAIKDMAGLLKPRAATMLIGSIRKKYPDLVIHVHTHDTAGTGVASMIACAEAGADVVDAAIDSMSGLTSQPSLGAICGAVAGTSLDTGIDPEVIYGLNSYWEQIRLLYSCFDPNVKSGDSGVYLHEMPGGQYTNLLFQSQQLGLGAQWIEIKQAYRVANFLCGDITKVTPSSKVVGDFAQFIVSQKLTEKDIHDKAETLSFPQSVLEYFQGYLGQPPYGFLEPLRSRILDSRRLVRVEGRPGASMPPADFGYLISSLIEQYGLDSISDTDVLSAALYPKVFAGFKLFLSTYGDLSSLPTRFFLTPLKVGQEFSFELGLGKTLIIKLVTIGPLGDTGRRDVYFSLNGETRLVSVLDTNVTTGLTKPVLRLKADPLVKGHIGSPMSGLVVELKVKVGDVVKLGDPIGIMSAMKMETVVTAVCGGKVVEVAVKTGESISAGDLMAIIE